MACCYGVVWSYMEVQVIAIPGLVLLALFVTGIFFLWGVSRAFSSPQAGTASAFNLIYPIITLILNILLTLMIVIRLYLHRRRITKLLGRRHATHCTSIIAMLIESAAIMVVMFLWFLIPLAMDPMGNQLANIPLPLIVQVQAAASYMIIFRVAKGTAWTSQTENFEFTIPDMPDRQGVLSNIQFQTASVEHPTDSSITSQSRHQFANGPPDVLDTESNSRSTVYESLLTDPAGVLEEARPN